MSDFPDDFVWGAATAAYQIEGATSEDGRGTSIWDTFARVPGAVVDGSNGDVADDHYHRVEEDIALLASLGLKAYRFSVAWPRVVPTGSGPVNQAGLDFYRRVAETCHAHGVTPYATLYHWDLPQPLEDAGGWLVRETAERFRDYAVATVDALADVVSHWSTLNEPWCSSLLGYGAGVHAPGQQVGARSLHAAHHLLLAHGLAVAAVRERHPELTIGITLNLYSVKPASGSELDLEAVRRVDGLQNRLFLDPVLLGRYPADVLGSTGTAAWFAERADDLATISTPVDFVGINYYSRHTVAGPADGVFADPAQASMLPGSERVELVDTGAPKTHMGWEVHPDGLVDVIAMVHERAPETTILVTENGAAYPDVVEADGSVQDKDRQEYFELHVEACAEAIRRGHPLRGYFAWSLMDNYEWAFGYTKRFGIVHVDYETQVRTVKASGRWFAELLA